MSKKISKSKDKNIDPQLRSRAETILKNQTESNAEDPSKKDVKQLYQELQIYQVELEMQDEELKYNQHELLESREKFAHLYDFAPIAYFTLNRKGFITSCNLSASQMLNLPKKLIEEQLFLKFINPENIDQFNKFFHSLNSNYTNPTCLVKIQTGGKSFIYGQVKGVVVKEENHTKGCFYITVMDITDQIEAELNLKESKESLEMALSASGIGTWHLDLKSYKIFWDKHSFSTFGVKSDTFDGTLESFYNIIHPDDKESVQKALRDCILNHTELTIQFRIVKPDKGVRYVESQGHFIIDNFEPVRFTGIVMDITERKKMEEFKLHQRLQEQKKILNAIIHTQESERKRISESLHDSLGQLLYAIKLKLTVDKKDIEKNHIAIDQMLENAITQTRNISFELSPAILKDFGLIVAIQETIHRISSTQLKIKTDIKGYNQRLSINFETSIYRIIQELLNNVLKHSAASEVCISITQTKKMLFINVEDNGVGFDPTENITAKSSGLSSIKNRIQLLDGQFDIDSFPGKGTRANIQLEVKE